MTIKALREKNGLTQEQFAAEMDVSRITIARIERGERLVAKTSFICRLMDRFGLTLQEAWDVVYNVGDSQETRVKEKKEELV